MAEIREDTQISRYLYAKSSYLRLPLSGTFELTPLCNMNCRMCYIRMSPEEMAARGQAISARQWIEMGRQCVEAGMVFLLFTGGEPFLRQDFQEIYSEIVKLGVVPSINSNATMVDERTANWLSQSPPSRVNVTLYGGSNETYSRLCRNPKGFDQATRGILLLRDAGVPVRINASFTRENVRDMDAIYAFAHAHDLKVRSTTYMFPPLRSAKEGKIDADMACVRFSPEEAGAAMARNLRCKVSPEEYTQAAASAKAGIFQLPDLDEECGRDPSEKMGCAAGKSSFWITWDGRMTPCGMLNTPVVRPFETGFAKAWERLYHETDEIYLPPACGDCKLRSACTICGATALAEGEGTPAAAPPISAK